VNLPSKETRELMVMKGIDAKLNSEAKTPPRLLVTLNDDNSIARGYIIADGLSVICSGNDLMDLLVSLVAVYYAWDLSFPRVYQILAFLQHYLLLDSKAEIFRGTPFTKLEKALGFGEAT